MSTTNLVKKSSQGNSCKLYDSDIPDIVLLFSNYYSIF